MIKINNLSVSYNSNLILDDITTIIKKNQFTTILGANGSGKSTLINAISKTLGDYSGVIYIDNTTISSIKKKDFAKTVAILFQFNTPPEDLTVKELIAFGRTPFKKMFTPLSKKDYVIIDEVIVQTDLTNLRHQKIEFLSGGEKQRVFLAMCLVQQPNFLILDEPTNHLDIKYQYQLLNIIKTSNIQNKITVLAILHDINQALKYSDQLIVLKDQKIYCQGKPSECISTEMIYDIYGIESIIHKDGNGLHVDFIV